ncbi:hypothetical protein SAMN05216215_11202 [Saccharopolyspora shandongensis]|uniref:Collagen triple helix repeat-containing protein n=1 Tax=Saccharopolyspora shandongensis TaxID=418495 RepID=A0A1H3UB57_9PSEU|nr:hypothetical protein [Saccharopolyspora shandongensis]SDZ59045.1 hypothetical protein SAMN05216215_11202 [Saccharopolyspora shandongensis]
MNRPQWMTWARARAVVLVLLILWVGWLTLTLGARTQQAAQETGRADTAERTLDQLADDVARACAQGGDAAAKLGAACATATEVKSAPPPRDGRNGRGITSTAITAGRLVVSYDDGTARDVGPVVGPTGPAGPIGATGPDGRPGTDGTSGRGIAGTSIDGTDLVVAYTDGTRENLGRVVGTDGRGITSTDTTGGRLIVTYDDGSTEDAGPLPQGPQGEPGPACPAGYELRPVLYLAPGSASTYEGVGCVEPGSNAPTPTNPTKPR